MSKLLLSAAFLASAWYGFAEDTVSMQIVFYLVFICKIALCLFAMFCSKDIVIDAIKTALEDKNYKFKNMLSWCLTFVEIGFLFYLGEPFVAAVLMIMVSVAHTRIKNVKNEVVK